jgi:phospholipid transport system substrate-binding protein
MRNNRLISIFLMVSLTLLIGFSNVKAGSESDPVSMLQSIANNMINGLKNHRATLKTNPQIVYRLAHQYVVPYADIHAMSQRVLPRQTWESATDQQRQQFEKEFTTLLIRTYASALSAYQDQRVQFYPVRGGVTGKNTIEVSSEIISARREPIRVSYRLVRVGGAWRLYDMSVEGVDMLESFRAQFADILSTGNMAQLLQRLSSHNTRS